MVSKRIFTLLLPIFAALLLTSCASLSEKVVSVSDPINFLAIQIQETTILDLENKGISRTETVELNKKVTVLMEDYKAAFMRALPSWKKVIFLPQGSTPSVQAPPDVSPASAYLLRITPYRALVSGADQGSSPPHLHQVVCKVQLVQLTTNQTVFEREHTFLSNLAGGFQSRYRAKLLDEQVTYLFERLKINHFHISPLIWP
ncbi:hypothetical protein GCM10027046_36960 [Uliginosibacterium flavum]|uniref:DUF4136 domain-containing protein n=1 Tax=Uliginosibacterium flavum TaxID=1396831 RepID=A0ABV2TN85_9RHOO